jgi:tetratricopeptide (TPR) repeat protein
MRTLLTTTFFLLLISILSAQSREDLIESFDEGDYFFVRREYSEAAYYFRKVVDSHPNNAHYNFRLGECYMNIPGSEALAISCFEKATTHTVAKNKYRSRDFSENSAPIHAWFYLGNVYRLNNRLKDALIAYNTFINSPLYYNSYNVNVVENEIKSCERAQIIMDSPVDAFIDALDTVINTSAAELSPVVSGDGQTMVFVRRLKFYDAILLTSKQGDTWSQIENLNPQVGSDGDFYPVSLSYNGNELYLVKTSLDNSDIYVSYLRNATWTKAEPLNKHINSKTNETWASVSGDGKTLWFTSARKGGQGGLDIYYSRRDDNFQWGAAKNAGKVINTPFDEESPCLTNNNQLLFFSSKGHYSMGGFDIFYTKSVGKTWKEPVNIGFPINNTADNLGYIPLDNGRTGYYVRNNAAGEQSSEDIFRVTLKSTYPLP